MRRRMAKSEWETAPPFLIMRRHTDGSVSNAIDIDEFEHAGTWGIVLADCVQHLVNAYVIKGMDASTTRAVIMEALLSELCAPTEKAHRVELED